MKSITHMTDRRFAELLQAFGGTKTVEPQPIHKLNGGPELRIIKKPILKGKAS